MNKIICVFLTFIMLLSVGAPVLAEEEKALAGEGLAVTTYVDVDRDAAREILTAMNAGEKEQKLADLLLAVVDAARHKLIINENGIGYQLFLKDTELLNVSAGMDEKGITILDSLLPDHAVTISNVVLDVGRAVYDLIESIRALQKEQAEVEKLEILEVVSPYIERFVNEAGNSIKIENPEIGSYDFGNDVTYNTRTQIDIDMEGILKGINGMFQDMSRDMTRDWGMPEVLGKLGITADDLQNVEIAVDNLPYVDLVVYSNTDKSGIETDSDMSVTFSVAPSKEEKAAMNFEAHMNGESYEANLGIPGDNDKNGVYATVRGALYNEETRESGSEFAVDFMGSYLALRNIVKPSDDDSAFGMTNQFYLLTSEKPLATAYSYVETENVPRLDLSIGDRREVTYTDLYRNERGNVIGDLFTSVRNSFQNMVDTAVEVVPELGELLNELSGEKTAAK